MPAIHICAEPDETAPRVRDVTVAAWYPEPPPMLVGETVENYTDRLVGLRDGNPYDHVRRRQCSIGFHRECTDPTGEVCGCPHHRETDDW